MRKFASIRGDASDAVCILSGLLLSRISLRVLEARPSCSPASVTCAFRRARLLASLAGKAPLLALHLGDAKQFLAVHPQLRPDDSRESVPVSQLAVVVRAPLASLPLYLPMPSVMRRIVARSVDLRLPLFLLLLLLTLSPE